MTVWHHIAAGVSVVLIGWLTFGWVGMVTAVWIVAGGVYVGVVGHEEVQEALRRVDYDRWRNDG